jgi:hypothetical protein
MRSAESGVNERAAANAASCSLGKLMPSSASPPPLPAPADDGARWLDPTYRVAVALRGIQSTCWGGEAIPSALLMAN